MATITLNGRKFAETNREFTESLFQGDGSTCAGYWKPDGRGGIYLLDHQKNRIGGVRSDYFVYRCARHPSRRGYWYQPVAPELLGGLDYPSYRSHDEARKAIGAALYGE